MKEYTSPVVLENEDLAEGVFTASGDAEGSTDCWTVGINSVQDWNGTHHVYEAWAIHSTDVVHITTQVTYTVTFNTTCANIYTEFGQSIDNSDTLTFTRDLHANGYHSGDRVTFKVWAKTADEATTKALEAPAISYVCRHETNVQGGRD